MKKQTIDKTIDKSIFARIGKSVFTPLTVLFLLFSLCLWNGRTISTHTRRWQAQTDRIAAMTGRGDWSGAEAALSESYRDWREKWTRLHIICRHDAVDRTEDLYRRCQILVQSNDPAGFLAELSSLREQLGGLSDMERLSLENIL